MKRFKEIKYNYYLTFIAIIAVLGVIFVLLRPAVRKYLHSKNTLRNDEPVLAIFDRTKPENNALISIQHYTVIWKAGAWETDKTLEDAIANNNVLITIETWANGNSTDENVLMQTLQGKFDSNIAAFAAVISKTKHHIYVRWNPDMEVPAYTYPWQFQSPQVYIQAYNYFASKLKSFAPDVKTVWGPSGYPGDTEYWPGNKYTDMVSITLGSASENSTDKYPHPEGAQEFLRAKLHRLRFINKSVLIIGSKTINSGNFSTGLLQQQLAYMNNYKDVDYSPANFVDSDKVKPLRKLLKVGVFDPNKRLIDQQKVSVEHIFTDLGEVQRGVFEKKFKEIIGRHHDAIVTMEPWRDTSNTPDSAVVKNILSGKFDQEIGRLFSIISSTSQTVYLRWMHEMEIPIHRYPWQSQDPVKYIEAYRYFMKFNGGPGKNVKKVWGPAGDRGSIDFWPGDDVVDYISIAIYGLPDKNITDPNKQELFSTIFNRKFYRMRFSDKPLFITEFGVKGPEEYQDKWLADAAKTINANPNVFGICYFNLYDNPKAWGHIKAPDWSITPQSLKKFCSRLK